MMAATPTTFAIAISLFPDSAAEILTDTSGALVPSATMVSQSLNLEHEKD